jgi:hypothetical protein
MTLCSDVVGDLKSIKAVCKICYQTSKEGQNSLGDRWKSVDQPMVILSTSDGFLLYHILLESSS